jgi:hypothetical protein
MNAPCDVCGLDDQDADESAYRTSDPPCAGCGARPRGGDPSARSDEEDVPVSVEDDERLEDLRVIARQSLAPSARPSQSVALEAPPSVRELIRAGEAIALIDTKRAAQRRLGIALAVALVAGGALVTAARARHHAAPPPADPAPSEASGALAPPREGHTEVSPGAAPPLESIASSPDAIASTPALSERAASESAAPTGEKKKPSSRKRARTGHEASPDAAADANADAPKAEAAPETPKSLADAIAEAAGRNTPSAGPTPGATSEGADAPPFDRGSAIAVLNSTASRIRGCKLSTADVGAIGISVKFLPTGSVGAARLDGPPFAGTPTGQCIEHLFRGARIAPFSGAPVIVHRGFVMK